MGVESKPDVAVRRCVAGADLASPFPVCFPNCVVDDDRVPSPEITGLHIRPVDLGRRARRGCSGCTATSRNTRTQGYVRRSAVVAPGARRNGGARVDARDKAEHLRSHGKGTWRLNVKPDNRARCARAAMGFETRPPAEALRTFILGGI